MFGASPNNGCCPASYAVQPCALLRAQNHTATGLVHRKLARCNNAPPARTSLVPSSLESLDSDPELQRIAADIAAKGQAQLTREERRERDRALTSLGLPAFDAALKSHGLGSLTKTTAKILQLNIGLYCNQACSHCHVESSPRRTEMMDRATAERCVWLLQHGRMSGVATLDITGGAPELNSQFRYLVEEASKLGLEVIDRCNLTVLLEPGQEDLPAFLAQHRVRVVASLPCYSASNVDKQRGAGVFERSIEGLKLLNELGYGKPGTGLQLDLVYNPGGAFLAPSQATLEAAYRQELADAYGIVFNSLLALNNIPIKRFADYLLRRGELESYMQLLVDAFNPATTQGLMCRDTVSVGWDGRVYCCDFNQQLALSTVPPTGWAPAASSSGDARNVGNTIPAAAHEAVPADLAGAASASSTLAERRPLTVFDLSSLDEMSGWKVVTGSHCYGCTAGAGSSCQGATA